MLRGKKSAKRIGTKCSNVAPMTKIRIELAVLFGSDFLAIHTALEHFKISRKMTYQAIPNAQSNLKVHMSVHLLQVLKL